MIKAIFMDYYGTMVYENGPISIEVVKRIYKNSNASSPEEVFRYWWETYKERLNKANGDNFRSQHDVALENFKGLLEHFHSSEDPEKLLERMEEHWCTVPVYEDAEQFLEKVELPVYFVTNSDDRYIYASMKKYDIHPAGVITSEQARYSKPRREIFQYALKKAGLKPEDVIHIGDSLQGDVECPESAGITALLLNRDGKIVPENVKSINSCMEALQFIKRHSF